MIWKQFLVSLIPGTCVAFASIFLYVQPPDCVQEIECKVGVQRGGFPLAVVKDKPESSPLSGWARISLEDSLFGKPSNILGQQPVLHNSILGYVENWFSYSTQVAGLLVRKEERAVSIRTFEWRYVTQN